MSSMIFYLSGQVRLERRSSKIFYILSNAIPLKEIEREIGLKAQEGKKEGGERARERLKAQEGKRKSEREAESSRGERK